MSDQVGDDGKIYWYLGIVEDIDDPLQLGRIKVRHITDHTPSLTEYVDTEDLPWAMPMTPSSSTSRFGIGISPVGITPGAYVLCFYLDGNKRTKPMVVGTWPVYNEDASKHSVSKLARGIGPVEKEYLDEEPQTQYQAEYPFNKTMTTVRGHVMEFDDTPDKERIHIFHRGGSYIEMNPDGSIVIKTRTNNFDIVNGDQRTHIEGKQTITIEKDQSISIKGNQDVSIEGNQTVNIKGNQTVGIDGSQTVTIKGSQNVNVDGNVKFDVGGTTTIDCSQVKMTGDLTVDGTVTGGKVKTKKGIDLDSHKHKGVNTGSGISGTPV